MKKILLSLLTIAFISTSSIAQSGYNNQNGLLVTASKSKKNINIEGSPFINETFLPIKLTNHEDKNLQARYNGYNGDMEVLDVTKGVVFVLNKNVADYDVTFTGMDKTYSIFNFIDEDGYISKDFFIKISTDSKVSLLKKEKVQYLGEKIATSTYDRARPAKYKRANDRYYIMLEGENAQVLPRKNKDLAKLFPDHTKDILSYIKTNKIKTSKEEGLIKLITYISTL